MEPAVSVRRIVGPVAGQQNPLFDQALKGFYWGFLALLQGFNHGFIGS